MLYLRPIFYISQVLLHWEPYGGGPGYFVKMLSSANKYIYFTPFQIKISVIYSRIFAVPDFRNIQGIYYTKYYLWWWDGYWVWLLGHEMRCRNESDNTHNLCLNDKIFLENHKI